MLTSGMWPVLGLVFNALVWGVSWWPLRRLQEHGLHAVWATAVFFAIGVLVIGLSRPSAWRVVAARPRLWALALAAGATNAAFNWGVATGEVVRVVLLFYLMPVWAVLLAWWMLGERITPGAMLRVGLALAGAVIVLRPADGGWPAFDGLADWLGLAGGLGFAFTNVLLRQLATEQAPARALAMFSGGLILPSVLGLVLMGQGQVAPPPAPQPYWVLLALGMGLLFVASNMALQYAAARLPVRITSVIMLTEVVFAAVTSVWWGGESLSLPVLGGGALILAAAVLAARDEG
ncbi:MAG TPA: DMT family transporter [Candidatus Aquabacterium excrementipullorum]|nr:DMT family transporter [Candidatus Aquabacterium excrementipullorum]